MNDYYAPGEIPDHNQVITGDGHAEDRPLCDDCAKHPHCPGDGNDADVCGEMEANKIAMAKNRATCCGQSHEIIQFAYKGPIQYGAECSVCGMRHAGKNPIEVIAAFFNDKKSVKRRKGKLAQPSTKAVFTADIDNWRDAGRIAWETILRTCAQLGMPYRQNKTNVEDAVNFIHDLHARAGERFNIPEIRSYLTGCLMLQSIGGEYTTRTERNQSLREAISDINDPQDGIKAVTERNRKEAGK
jgi:hypothetical protein